MLSSAATSCLRSAVLCPDWSEHCHVCLLLQQVSRATTQDDFELGSIPLAATATAYTSNATAGPLTATASGQSVQLTQTRLLEVVLDIDNNTRVSHAGTNAATAQCG
jgi:hypothetical protein